MYRVSTNMMGDNLIEITRRNTNRMLELQTKISSGKKNRLPRDNPVEVGHSILYRRAISEIEQYEKNVDDGLSRLKVTDSALENVTNILQRIRELGVQGSNGTYTKEDRKKIAAEINELFEELVNVANSKYKGKAIFGGNDTLEEPFKVHKSFNKYAGKEVIEKVEYYGDIGNQNREIAQGDIMSINSPGNEVFWAENANLFSSVDASNYIVAKDSTIRINGVEIHLKAGDNIETIVTRINDAPVPVRASVNRMNGGIVLETSSARDLWIEDIGGSTVMQDLGVISGKLPPKNLSPTARYFGGTVFDMVKQLRDSLYRNDVEDVGSRALGGIDLALDNVLKYRAELGAKSNRLEMAKKRLVQEKSDFEEILSSNEDVDVAEAITKLKMLEVAHQAALGVSARIIQPTLLDFLR
ncbi:MAG: flagellar hook-associated protein 3 [Spirochaetes bacterium]|nr:MAG: flagellar hook-associated protein 3 [Spirochaetota bacterium]